ncbi:type II toxin-antitoxin system HipA family toxin [Shewanella sp. A32]|uniref:type II toxin-antitoxin system HipA family toxin n=1 Tax=Shewanella sp. A32 TaxID=3031327 RepID=UPI0023B92F1C|nr:type II toxin-antitoxin system HipA family toxin [Shewanella sp. A32]MDF0534679.1 type II toxin-antitoxin system HipA family toxin [Shewanella sp. A32]
MPSLDVYMNGYMVGVLSKLTNGAHHFKYDTQWLATAGTRPISMAMPLRRQEYQGDEVYNFFDNLLPDNSEIRQRIVARYQTNSNQPFDLLTAIGMDCIGAIQLMPHGVQPDTRQPMQYKPLTDTSLQAVLTGYQQQAPLGMIESEDDFRISIAGAQEKTALLKWLGQWCLPVGGTPTSHIIKLPIGKIETHSYSIDLSDSVENEFLCTQLSAAFGLDVPECSILKTGNIKALAVERFDRRLASDGQQLLRLPQEDFCQVLNVPSAKKYETHGGPGIKQIMDFLRGSMTAEQDRYNFMKAQVIFWLLAATDGHAKNFSIFIRPEGRYQLTPFYDIISMYPAFGGRGLHLSDAKLAMGLTTSKGKKYKIDQILPRHFFNTAKQVGFSQEEMRRILQDFTQQAEGAIANVKVNLPEDFPNNIRDSICDGLLAKVQRLTL